MEHVRVWNEMLSTKLEPQLVSLEAELKEHDIAIQEYVELTHIISALLNRDDPSGRLEAKIEDPKGSGKWKVATVNDTSKIFVDIGLEHGQHVELTLQEAEIAVHKRVQQFTSKKVECVARLEKLNKDIFVGMATVQQLQQLEQGKK